MSDYLTRLLPCLALPRLGFCALLAILLGAPITVAAQDSHSNSAGTTSSLNVQQYASEDTPRSSDGYVTPTVKRLSELYWALAVFDLGDNQAIDNYLKIHECELYNKYYASDFELMDLRAATRQSIVQNMASFDKKFEVMIPLGLGRYDTGTEKFKLLDNSVFMGSRRLEINVNNEGSRICGSHHPIPGYPKNFILTLNRPFLLTEIPLSPEVAQKLMEESQKLAEKHRYRYQISPLGRVAFLRLKISISQFRSYYKPQNMPLVADLFGNIDGYEIYADQDKEILLYRQYAPRDSILTRRKRAQTDVTPASDTGTDKEAVIDQTAQADDEIEEHITPATGTTP